MEAAGCIVLHEGGNLELIGVDEFMPRADLWGHLFRAVEFDRGKVGETAVMASARSPSCSWAIFRTTVLSIPPEKATRTDCMSERSLAESIEFALERFRYHDACSSEVQTWR